MKALNSRVEVVSFKQACDRPNSCSLRWNAKKYSLNAQALPMLNPAFSMSTEHSSKSNRNRAIRKILVHLHKGPTIPLILQASEAGIVLENFLQLRKNEQQLQQLPFHNLRIYMHHAGPACSPPPVASARRHPKVRAAVTLSVTLGGMRSSNITGASLSSTNFLIVVPT